MPKYFIADAKIRNNIADLYKVDLDEKEKEVARERVGTAIWAKGFWSIVSSGVMKSFSTPVACAYTLIHKKYPQLMLGKPHRG